jgi:protein transport protein SEC24
VIHPLSPDADVPLVNFGRTPIPRCRSCRAYINPFVQWLENGRRWRCNFCVLINDSAPDYVCALGADGERLDRLKRAELSRGAVEFVAPSEYMVRAPPPPTFVFIVDVSYASVRGGVLAAVAAALRRAVDELSALERAQFALFTFDDHVHFYAFKVRWLGLVASRL